MKTTNQIKVYVDNDLGERTTRVLPRGTTVSAKDAMVLDRVRRRNHCTPDPHVSLVVRPPGEDWIAAVASVKNWRQAGL